MGLWCFPLGEGDPHPLAVVWGRGTLWLRLQEVPGGGCVTRTPRESPF